MDDNQLGPSGIRNPEKQTVDEMLQFLYNANCDEGEDYESVDDDDFSENALKDDECK